MPDRCTASWHNRRQASAIRRAGLRVLRRCAHLSPTQCQRLQRRSRAAQNRSSNPPSWPFPHWCSRTKQRVERPAALLFSRSLLPNQVILRRNYLPASVLALPSIGELIPTIERTALSLSAQMQHSGDHVHVAEVVQLHPFVARPFDVIRACNAPDDITASHH